MRRKPVRWLLFYVVFMMYFRYGGAHAADLPVSFDLSRIRVSEVVQLLYRDVLKTPYVALPDVVADDRIVSFRLASTKQVHADVVKLLDSFGLSVSSSGGFDVVSVKKDAEPEKHTFVYRPRYRDASFLAELVRPAVKGTFTVQHQVATPTPAAVGSAPVPAGSAASMVDRNADVLVFEGTGVEVSRIEQIFSQVDKPQGEVMVRGIVYEVGSSDKDGSAFSLALNLLGSKLSVTGGVVGALDNAVRLHTTSIDAVFSALSTDSRFKVVSSPSLRVRSGAAGRFSVGQDVPVLGAVSYPGNGQAPVQSVEYRSSGVIFDLAPVVHDAIVDLNVTQQISSFVATDTGVSGSPTLIKREVKTSLSLGDGDIVLLGGLAENKESAGRNGLSFLPDFMKSRNSESSRSEILLVLQLTKI
jgi:general secretion pathway protein D